MTLLPRAKGAPEGLAALDTSSEELPISSFRTSNRLVSSTTISESSPSPRLRLDLSGTFQERFDASVDVAQQIGGTALRAEVVRT